MGGAGGAPRPAPTRRHSTRPSPPATGRDIPSSADAANVPEQNRPQPRVTNLHKSCSGFFRCRNWGLMSLVPLLLCGPRVTGSPLSPDPCGPRFLPPHTGGVRGETGLLSPGCESRGTEERTPRLPHLSRQVPARTRHTNRSVTECLLRVPRGRRGGAFHGALVHECPHRLRVGSQSWSPTTEAPRGSWSPGG